MATFSSDNNVALEVADLLRAAGHAAVTARDLGLEGASDDEQLLVASRQGRIFVTHNERDFILLHDAWQRWTEARGVADRHAGILIVPQGTRYGVDWGATRIAQELITGLHRCRPVANELFRRKEAGWERRVGKGWSPCL